MLYYVFVITLNNLVFNTSEIWLIPFIESENKFWIDVGINILCTKIFDEFFGRYLTSFLYLLFFFTKDVKILEIFYIISKNVKFLSFQTMKNLFFQQYNLIL